MIVLNYLFHIILIIFPSKLLIEDLPLMDGSLTLDFIYRYANYIDRSY